MLWLRQKYHRHNTLHLHVTTQGNRKPAASRRGAFLSHTATIPPTPLSVSVSLSFTNSLARPPPFHAGGGVDQGCRNAIGGS